MAYKMENIKYCTFLATGRAARMALDDVLAGRSYEAKYHGNELTYNLWLKESQLEATLGVLATYENLQVIKHTMNQCTFFVEYKEA